MEIVKIVIYLIIGWIIVWNLHTWVHTPKKKEREIPTCPIATKEDAVLCKLLAGGTTWRDTADPEKDQEIENELNQGYKIAFAKEMKIFKGKTK